MGLGQSDLELLIHLRRTNNLPDAGQVAEIGAQQLSNSFLRATSELNSLGSMYGKSGRYSMPEVTSSKTLAGGYEHQEHDAPFARPFWEWLGYSYMAIDIDGSPNSIPLDLNYDDVPAKAAKQCQLVTNYGTTEHVANQLNAFKIIHELTALNGIMIHNLPAQGMFNHGLVNYNPKFFWMLARSNRYRTLFMDVTCGSEMYSLPDNVAEFIQCRSGPKSMDRFKDYKSCDAAIIVALQKVEDIDFVAPIDVNSGTMTDNEALRRRYWTVFGPQSKAKHYLRWIDGFGTHWRQRLARLQYGVRKALS